MCTSLQNADEHVTSTPFKCTAWPCPFTILNSDAQVVSLKTIFAQSSAESVFSSMRPVNADAPVHFDLHHLLPLIVKKKTAQITAGHSFHFKKLHLGFREFHLMFLRRVQKPDGRWAKQVSKERHRLGESERWQSCQDNAISNGCAPRCLQSAEGSETGSDTRLGSRGHWQAPAVPQRTGEKW